MALSGLDTNELYSTNPGLVPVTAGQLTRQANHDAALRRNVEIRSHYGTEEFVMAKQHDLKFFQCAAWAIPVGALAWAAIIWGIYKLCQ